MYLNEIKAVMTSEDGEQTVSMSFIDAFNMLTSQIRHLSDRIDSIATFTFMTEAERMEYKANMEKHLDEI